MKVSLGLYLLASLYLLTVGADDVSVDGLDDELGEGGRGGCADTSAGPGQCSRSAEPRSGRHKRRALELPNGAQLSFQTRQAGLFFCISFLTLPFGQKVRINSIDPRLLDPKYLKVSRNFLHMSRF